MPGLANPSPPDPRMTHEDVCGCARICCVLGRDPPPDLSSSGQGQPR